MSTHVDQTIAELITNNGLRAVLGAVETHCQDVTKGDADPHEDDEEGGYELVSDGVLDLLDELG